jgi:uncharacterized protein (DUF58 family)
VAAALKTQLTSPVGLELPDLIRLKPAGETIKLTTPRVRAIATGGHLSPFKGRGVEFDESRLYQPGDDLRTIDWRVTARTGKPYTKVFREERNRPVIIWLDLHRSMMFATRRAYKAVVAAELAALIGWSAVGNGDQLGGLVFSQSAHHELRPRLGRRAVLRLFGLMTGSQSWSGSEEAEDSRAMDHALLRLTRVSRPGSMMFLLSDFLKLSTESERHIRQLASHGDLFLVQIYDPLEAELPPPGRYRIQYGRQSFTIETSDEKERAAYRQRFELRVQRLRALDNIPGVRLLRCSTADDPYSLLMKYFARA